MKFKILIFTFFTLLLSSVNAQQKTFTESINEYININGTEEQYSDAIDQLFVMLKQQYASSNVPEYVWEELKTKKTRALYQIKIMLASAYRSHFEHDNIKDLINFYNSSAGKQYKIDPTALSEKQKDEITLFYQSPTGKVLNQQAESLNLMCAEISESWSRSLYMEMKDELAAKGYLLE